MGADRAAFIATLLIGAAAHAQPAATFQGLGRFNGEFITRGTVVSDEGPVVGGVVAWFDGEHISDLGFTWTPSSGFNQTVLPGEVRGISASGDQLAGQYNIYLHPNCCGPEDYTGYYGTPEGVTHVLQLPHVATDCRGIFADGSAAIGTGPGTWRWSPSTGYIQLPSMLGYGFPNAASADGVIIVGYARPAGILAQSAMKWHGSSQEYISAAPNIQVVESEATDISRDGRIIVGWIKTPTGTRAARAPEDGKFRLLPAPPGSTYSRATATNADGNIVVGWSTATHLAAREGFIWTRSAGMRDLKQRLLQWGAHNVADWTYLDVRDISGDGRYLVGTGRNPQNQPEAFLATIPPFCYANCDNSFTPPILNVDDFTCFINRFAANDPYANCDNSTAAPILNVDDFTCFINLFAAGCPE